MPTSSDVQAYRDALSRVLDGSRVPSVQDPLSVASNFGQGDRPSLEVLAATCEVESPLLAVLQPAAVRVNAAYCVGLLAWSLDGRQDVESLEYYRPGGRRFADDAGVLCGAFGRRLLRSGGEGGQLAAVMARLRDDPATRRTWLPIAVPADNVEASREYPCASGVQLFRRGDELHFLTVMRAQHALTVMPYDMFLFRALHSAMAAMLDLDVGKYIHFAGTLHIYEAEVDVAREVLAEEISVLELPHFPRGADAQPCVNRLVELERAVRTAAQDGDRAKLVRLQREGESWSVIEECKAILVAHATTRLEA